MLGYKVKSPKLIKGHFTMENSVLEMAEYSLIMKLLYKYIVRVLVKGFGGEADYQNPSFLMFLNMTTDCSLSGLKTNNRMQNYILEGLLAMANGQFFRGIKLLAKKNNK